MNYSPVNEGISDIIVGVFTADDPEGQTLSFQISDPNNNFIVSYYISVFHVTCIIGKRLYVVIDLVSKTVSISIIFHYHQA